MALHFSVEIILIHVVSTTPVVPASPALTGVNDLQVLTEMENAAQETIAKDAERLLDNSLESHLMVINGNADLFFLVHFEPNRFSYCQSEHIDRVTCMQTGYLLKARVERVGAFSE